MILLRGGSVLDAALPACPTPVAQPPKWLAQVQQLAVAKGQAETTARAFVAGNKAFILFHNKRHPKELGRPEIRRYLNHVAATSKDPLVAVAASRAALAFLYEDIPARRKNWAGKLCSRHSFHRAARTRWAKPGTSSSDWRREECQSGGIALKHPKNLSEALIGEGKNANQEIGVPRREKNGPDLLLGDKHSDRMGLFEDNGRQEATKRILPKERTSLAKGDMRFTAQRGHAGPREDLPGQGLHSFRGFSEGSCQMRLLAAKSDIRFTSG